MNQIELEKHYIVRDGHTFTPRTEYTEIEIVDELTAEVTIDFDYTITTTAEEVYQEWLAQKDALPQPNETEVLTQRIIQNEEAIGILATQIARNTLLK